jgi:hypothetical protein
MASSFIDKQTMATVIGTIFDNATVRPLRPNYIYDSLAQEKNWMLTTPPKNGDTMQFAVLSAYSSNTAALSPTSLDYGSQTNTYVRRTVALSLYGDHSAIDVMECVPETFIDDISDSAFSLTDQAMNSLNKLARNAIDLNKYSNETSGTLSSTYHAYGSYGAGASTVGPLNAKDVRRIVSELKADNVQVYPDGYYYGVINPVQYTQLRADSDNAAWSKVNENVESGAVLIRRGSIGTFEGVKFFIDNEVAGNGTGTISAYFMGREHVGKAIGHDVRVGTKATMVGPHDNIMVMCREAGRIVECSNTKL